MQYIISSFSSPERGAASVTCVASSPNSVKIVNDGERRAHLDEVFVDGSEVTDSVSFTGRTLLAGSLRFLSLPENINPSDLKIMGRGMDTVECS